MTYLEGFVLSVPTGNKDAFTSHAEEVADAAREFGVTRQLEAWEDDVPEGKVTDFRKAVNANPGEKVVFSFFEYPSKAQRDAANEKFRTDPRMQPIAERTPFDGKRMIMGGFEAIVEEGSGGGGYIDGFVVPVPEGKLDAYRDLASKMAKVFRQHGANRVVEAFSDDVPKGDVTDFYRAVRAEEGEGIVFSFIEWPDKQARDSAWDKIMADESLRPQEMPFDGKRMFWGGFDVLIDTARQQQAQQATAPITA
jgi:uncharacterized protein YbaA (DUF1428 family)